MYEVIKEDLQNYHWMVKEIRRIEECLTAQKINRKEALESTLFNLKLKVLRVDIGAEHVTDPTDRLILKSLLEGERPTNIARSIKFSRTAFYKRKKKIINKIAAHVK